jgi:hypothetical protein
MYDAKDQTNDQQINGTFREHHISTQASYRSAKTAKTKETRLMINKINYSSEHAHTSLVITLAQVYKGERLLLFNLSFSKR